MIESIIDFDVDVRVRVVDGAVEGGYGVKRSSGFPYLNSTPTVCNSKTCCKDYVTPVSPFCTISGDRRYFVPPGIVCRADDIRDYGTLVFNPNSSRTEQVLKNREPLWTGAMQDFPLERKKRNLGR